jgi:hypothetical protein
MTQVMLLVSFRVLVQGHFNTGKAFPGDFYGAVACSEIEMLST